jgi:hypothetical protein
MAGHLRRNAVAYLALFVALGGTSYAAIKLPANSVGAKQIRRNSVTSAKVKNGTLNASDFARGVQLAGPAGPAGATGPPGAAGPKGDPGPAGPTLGFNAPTGGCCDAGSFDFTVHSIASETVHLPFAARLYVDASARVQLTCTSGGSCEEDYDVTVDGTGVPQSEQKMSAAASQTTPFTYVNPSGITGVLPAGDHVIRIARQDGSSFIQQTGFGDVAFNEIALGG